MTSGSTICLIVTEKSSQSSVNRSYSKHARHTVVQNNCRYAEASLHGEVEAAIMGTVRMATIPARE